MRNERARSEPTTTTTTTAFLSFPHSSSFSKLSLFKRRPRLFSLQTREGLRESLALVRPVTVGPRHQGEEARERERESEEEANKLLFNVRSPRPYLKLSLEKSFSSSSFLFP